MSGEGPSARAPLFLTSGAGAIARILLRDLGNFILVLLYYPILWLIGAPLLMIDRRLGTHWLDRLIRLAEHLDE